MKYAKSGLLALCLSTVLAGPSAAATVYNCAVKPISPQKQQCDLNYRLTVQEDGRATIEGVRGEKLRVTQNARKVRVNWVYNYYRFSQATDRSTVKTTLNVRADGYTGSLRWDGTCTKM